MDARYALVVLFLVNVMNYVARNVLAAMLPLVQSDLGASDALAGLLGSALMWSYLVSAPFLGHLADRSPRRRIVALGAAAWSLGTAACGISSHLASLFAWRGVVGAGEAAFSSAAPAMIADLVPAARRNRALTVFYIALPLGTGLGFVLGGALSQRIGWRQALLLTGSPGLLLAALAWRLREPRRGGLDALPAERPQPIGAAVRRLRSIRSFCWALAGQVLLTFGLGGVAAWLPTFLVRAHGMGLERAGLVSGGALVVGSLAGTLFGGALAELWERRSANALIHTSTIGMVIAAALSPFLLLPRGAAVLTPLLVAINFFLFWHTGPLNTLFTNVVPPSIRATSVAFQILVIHLLGDALSPGLLGAGSDFLQSRGLDGAEALRWMMLVLVPPSLLLAAVLTQIAAYWAPDDLARVVGPRRR